MVSPEPADGVKLLGLGEEPRRIVQYHLTKGARAHLQLAMDMDLEAGRPTSLPTVALTFELQVEDVRPSGARIHTRITEARMIERAHATVPASALAPMTEALTGLGYAFTLAPDGTLSEGRVTGTPPAAMRGELEQMLRSIEQVALRLPVVPVGVGATWSTTRTVAQNGMKLTTVTTTKLTRLEQERLSFTTQTTLSAPDQETVQQGVAVTTKDLGGAGSGTGTIDLTTMAMRGELGSELRGTLVTSGQPPSTMRMVMSLRLE